MGKIKIGQIGVSHEHAAVKMQSLRILTDIFEIVGVVDDSNSTAARFAGFDLKPSERKVYNGLTFMSIDELLQVDGLEAVVIETPNGDLVPIAIKCMERGLAMHMDKPGGEEFSQFKQLLEGCERKSIPFQMGYMFRSNPAMQFCSQALKNGLIGDVFEIQASMSHNYGGEGYQDYIGQFAGGIMFNLGCHIIDYIVSIMGRPQGITPFLKNAPGDDNHIKNNCLTILEYPNATVTLRACSREVDGLAKRTLKICGTKGTLELSPLEIFDGSALTMKMSLLEDTGEYSAGDHNLNFGVFNDRYKDQFLELAKIIKGEMDNPYSYKHDHLVQEVVLAASGYTQWRGEK